MKKSYYWNVGKRIFEEVLSDRKGFDLDLDDDIWDDIYEEMGRISHLIYQEKEL